jgi:AAA domain
MGTPAEFLLEAFAGRSQAPVCILCLPNIRGAFPPSEIYTRDLAEAEAFVKERDGPGAAIYFGANTTLPGRKRNKDNVAEIVTLHADLDFKTIAASPDIIDQVLRALPLPPSTIVDSGNGFHGYWRFREALPPALRERVEAALRRLAWALAGDPAVCEIARIMRLPGSHNTKDGAWKPVLVRWNSGREYSFEELEEWLSGLESPLLARLAPPPKAGKNGNGHADLAGDGDPFAAFGAEAPRIPIDVEEELDAMWFKGGYNGVNLTQFRVIGSLLHEGIPVDQAIDYVVESIWARIPESAGWKRHEEVEQLRDMSKRTIQGRPHLLDLQEAPPKWLLQRLGRIEAGPGLKAIFDAATAAEPKPDPDPSSKPEPEPPPKPPGKGPIILKRLFLEELQIRAVIARKWVVDQFVLAGQLNGLFGDGGVGKDYLLLQLAIAMTCGGQWLGREVLQGRVIYFPIEDDLDEVRRRESKITAFMASNGIYEPRDRELMIVPMVGEDAVLGVYDSRRGVVAPTGVFAAIEKLVAEFKPTLVIVGNRVNIFSVNQNDDAHAVQSLRLLSGLCARHETAVLMPGHVSVTGMNTGSGTSGSVQWSNGVRLRMYLQRLKDEQTGAADPNRRVLQVMKTNWGPPDQQIDLQWSEGLFVGDGFTITAPEPEAGESEAEMNARLVRQRVESDDAAFLAALDRHTAVGSYVSAAPTAKTNAPNIFSQDEECLPGVRMAEKKKRMKVAMGRLFMRGIIQTKPWGSPSRGMQRIERTTVS